MSTIRIRVSVEDEERKIVVRAIHLLTSREMLQASNLGALARSIGEDTLVLALIEARTLRLASEAER